MKTPLYLFPGGKTKAVTFSYDDGVRQDERLAEMFDRYALKATFNINSGMDYESKLPLNAEVFKKVYGNHEVASHAEFHSGLDRIAATDVLREVWADRQKLEDLTGYPVAGFAYPCGQYSEYVKKILRTAGIEYARTTKSIGVRGRWLPSDFLEWHPTCHHREALEIMPQFLDEKRALMQLFYVWGHSYEFDGDKNWDMMEEICGKLSGHDDVWYATNIQICRYLKAIRALVSGANGHLLYNPTAETVWFFADGWKMSDVRSIAPGETVTF